MGCYTTVIIITYKTFLPPSTIIMIILIFIYVLIISNPLRELIVIKAFLDAVTAVLTSILLLASLTMAINGLAISADKRISFQIGIMPL